MEGPLGSILLASYPLNPLDGSIDKRGGAVRAFWITYALKHPEAVAAAYGGVMIHEVMIYHSYLALAVAGTPERLHAGLHPGVWEPLPTEVDGLGVR